MYKPETQSSAISDSATRQLHASQSYSGAPLATKRHSGCSEQPDSRPGKGRFRRCCAARGGGCLCFIYQTPQTTPPHAAPPPEGLRPRPAPSAALPVHHLGAPPPPRPPAPSGAGPTSPAERAPRPGPTQSPCRRPERLSPPRRHRAGPRARRPHREAAVSGSALTGPGGGGGARGPTAAATLYGGGGARGEGGRTRLALPRNRRAARRDRLSKTPRPDSQTARSAADGKKRDPRRPWQGGEGGSGAEARRGGEAAAVVPSGSGDAAPGAAEWAGAPRAGQRLRRPSPAALRGRHGLGPAPARCRREGAAAGEAGPGEGAGCGPVPPPVRGSGVSLWKPPVMAKGAGAAGGLWYLEAGPVPSSGNNRASGHGLSTCVLKNALQCGQSQAICKQTGTRNSVALQSTSTAFLHKFQRTVGDNCLTWKSCFMGFRMPSSLLVTAHLKMTLSNLL
ncbi:uncharacterized protein LOC142414101 [Mycteria americana]|uniref:uncharacterized protein LOC142414101 n=1 Tax=Mycteria americana TaxID=33587 RepID=UPI003F585051